MKLLSTVLIVAAVATSGDAIAASTNLQTTEDKISYSIGVDLGKKFAAQEVKINPQVFTAGLKDGITNAQTAISEEEMAKTLTEFQQQLIAKKAQEFKQLAENNLSAGEAFLAKNKTSKGVVTLNSGLQYKVIKDGTGNSPAKSDMVTTHYSGKFIDGTEFDSSYKRGEPATFPVDGVIAGWTEALQLMKPGAKWQLFIPAKLAYGESGVGMIGPNQTLIFDVELLKVEKSEG